MNSDQFPAIRVATTDEIAGARIAITLTVVMGIAIRSRGIGGNILAGLDVLGNGSALTEYRDLLAAARDEAVERMSRAAAEVGANAVVGMRFDSAEAGREIVEIVAYGTAVVLQAI
jgi:uncharacterized protein YbjQ (UPF0145 family)